jgi:hypothetical protein
MAAVYVSNLVVNTGTTFTQTFSLENSDSSSSLNLGGYTVSAQMRKHAGSSAYTSFTASILNPSAGTIKVGLGTTTTVSLKPGRYVYDVLITDNSGVITRVVEGSVLVREGVTR